MKKNVGVLFGGRSGEHEVSICSAASVILNIDRDKYDVTAIFIDKDGRWYVQNEINYVDDKDFGRILSYKKDGKWHLNHYENNGKLVLEDVLSGNQKVIDIVFPAVHGTFCEDGTLQGLLELAMVPYVGPDVIGSSVGMDKDVAKRLLRDGNIPIVPWKVYNAIEWETEKDLIIDEITNIIDFPCFIKPSSAGSSVGISKISDVESISAAMEEAFRWDFKVLVEKNIDAREIEFAVLGNNKPVVSIPGEIRPKHSFYSYEAKYLDKDGAELIVPAVLDEELKNEMSATALKAYKILCCSGMARIDFFLDKNSGQFYVNEINTLPGFTSVSMYPKLWSQTGLSYVELLDRLLELAIERQIRKKSLVCLKSSE